MVVVYLDAEPRAAGGHRHKGKDTLFPTADNHASASGRLVDHDCGGDLALTFLGRGERVKARGQPVRTPDEHCCNKKTVGSRPTVNSMSPDCDGIAVSGTQPNWKSAR